MLLESYQIAETINLKQFRANYLQTPVYATVWDAFYVDDKQRFIHVFGHGVVVFVGYEISEKNEFIQFLTQFSQGQVDGDVNEDFTIHLDSTIQKPIVKNNSITLPHLEYDTVRIVTLNVAQSVALDYYDSLSLEMLKSSKKHIDELEQFGKIQISKKNLLKFIGKIKNIKNSIIDNLYILDDPNIVWDNEELEKINNQLKETFDISPRFRDLDYRLRIVEENLILFTNLLQHRESARLEWIIIILILVEILNVFLGDWLKKIFDWIGK
ncbi:MAG: RMD1 family protein [Raineya sp.]|nr:RMD1 family protein [Raineya sp.]